jgi:phosphate-selective porin OprO/OprP
MSRSRIGLEGTILGKFEYEVEYDFAREEDTWRDIYLNYRGVKWLQVQGGRFKLPFGRDQLTSPAKLDFIYRSRIGAGIAPGRQTGVMLHGPLFKQGLRYQAGVFLHDGENSYGSGDAISSGRTVALRLRSVPADLIPLPAWLRTLEVGAAATEGTSYAGRFGLRGRTAYEDTFFPRMEVSGTRRRLGAELGWTVGQLSMQAEVQELRQQRLAQGIFGDNLPDLIAYGWYLSGAWLLAGKRKSGWVEPRLPLMQGGAGTLELTGRLESIDFFSASRSLEEWTGRRAANFPLAADRAITLGLNWYWNRYSRVQWNLIHDSLVSPFQYVVDPRISRWAFAVRLQFFL